MLINFVAKEDNGHFFKVVCNPKKLLYTIIPDTLPILKVGSVSIYFFLKLFQLHAIVEFIFKELHTYHLLPITFR